MSSQPKHLRLRNRGASFRKWLVERVSMTNHALGVNDDEVDTLAERMGILPDVLLEARIMARTRRIEAGRAAPSGRRRAGSNHYQLELLFPPEVFEQWKQEAENRGVLGSVLMRSLVHAYLMGTFEPDTISRHWEYRGIVYSLPHVHKWAKEHGRRYPYRERTHIPQGAKRALTRRADKLGVEPAIVVKSLILLMLNNRWAYPGTIKMVDAANMYDDEDRYAG